MVILWLEGIHTSVDPTVPSSTTRRYDPNYTLSDNLDGQSGVFLRSTVSEGAQSLRSKQGTLVRSQVLT